jgi:tripeptide aminopeptidase
MKFCICLVTTILLVSVSPAAQERATEVGPLLLKDATVSAAVSAVKKNEPWVLEEQVRLCEIAAPPFKEAARGKAYAQAFRDLGLKNVRIDKVGNVLGERPGAAARPHVVFSAHLDTVFPEETDVRVTRLGSVLKGPGIGDDCRGLAVVLGVIKAMADANVQTEGTITFVGTVGEEGLGDLRGVKQLFEGELKGKIDRFVSIDGTGLGITHIGVGSRRYRVAFKGPGGHSYGAFGLANPVHALGRAIAKIGDFRVPTEPKTTFNVGRVGGGTSVNSIAFEAWAEVDLRSADTASLQSVDANFHKAVDTALEEENLRWANRGKLAVEKTLAGDRPAGRTPANSAIVQSAVSVTTALGLQATLDEGSTDANIPMSLNIPAVTIDGGGRGTGAHSLGETFDSTNSEQGTSRALLLAIALTRR